MLSPIATYTLLPRASALPLDLATLTPLMKHYARCRVLAPTGCRRFGVWLRERAAAGVLCSAKDATNYADLGSHGVRDATGSRGATVWLKLEQGKDWGQDWGKTGG